MLRRYFKRILMGIIVFLVIIVGLSYSIETILYKRSNKDSVFSKEIKKYNEELELSPEGRININYGVKSIIENIEQKDRSSLRVGAFQGMSKEQVTSILNRILRSAYINKTLKVNNQKKITNRSRSISNIGGIDYYIPGNVHVLNYVTCVNGATKVLNMSSVSEGSYNSNFKSALNASTKEQLENLNDPIKEASAMYYQLKKGEDGIYLSVAEWEKTFLDTYRDNVLIKEVSLGNSYKMVDIGFEKMLEPICVPAHFLILMSEYTSDPNFTELMLEIIENTKVTININQKILEDTKLVATRHLKTGKEEDKEIKVYNVVDIPTVTVKNGFFSQYGINEMMKYLDEHPDTAINLIQHSKTIIDLLGENPTYELNENEENINDYLEEYVLINEDKEGKPVVGNKDVFRQAYKYKNKMIPFFGDVMNLWYNKGKNEDSNSDLYKPPLYLFEYESNIENSSQINLDLYQPAIYEREDESGNKIYEFNKDMDNFMKAAKLTSELNKGNRWSDGKTGKGDDGIEKGLLIGDIYKLVFHNTNYTSCCGGGVSEALFLSGIIDIEDFFLKEFVGSASGDLKRPDIHSPDIANHLANQGLVERIWKGNGGVDELMPGDIVTMKPYHIQIFVGYEIDKETR